MGGALAAAIRDLGLTVDPDEVDRRAAEALRAVVPRRLFLDPATEFPAETLSLLREGGFDTSPPRPGDEDPVLRAAEAYMALLGSSLSVPQVARLLGVDGSLIRRRLLARQLYGIRRPAGWLVPAFQFDGGGVVPGLDRVLPHLSPAMHPLAIVRWFTTPHPELVRPDDPEETALAPIDWLRIGGDPTEVAELAESAAGFA
ncbi:MAG TPA: hypothetical protein VG370_09630 [Chloroflexota bacterium]|jgi:hypothetical protein|nr:hypothetical protein [Chloroflexota bacterium]